VREILADAALQPERIGCMGCYCGGLIVIGEFFVEAMAEMVGDGEHRARCEAFRRIGGDRRVDAGLVAGGEEMMRRVRRQRQHLPDRFAERRHGW
jgi:hypothetical protein